MALTGSTVAVADKVLANITAARVALGIPEEGLFYGDQNKIPVTPTVCVEPGDKTRELRGVPRKTNLDVTIYVIVYHSTITDIQTNRREADVLSDAVETLLHEDRTMGGLLIHSFVVQVESGYATKTESIMRAARLTFVGQSQQHLPFP